MNLIEKWNSSHKNIPVNKSYSNYAVEKETEFPLNSLVLDLGGGTGSDSLYFLSKGHLAVLADISDYALTVAYKKSEESSFNLETKHVIIGTDNLPFQDNQFDVVYSRLALHYFDKKVTEHVFKEINRILKKGGKCFLTVKSPNDNAEMEFLRQSAIESEPGVFNENGELKSRFTIDQLNEILKLSGITKFKVTEYKEDLGNRIDKTKSGNSVMLLNEITWKK